jgi:tetratricopeptide (TPR) repeat protein
MNGFSCLRVAVVAVLLVVIGCGGKPSQLDNAEVLIDLGKAGKAIEIIEQVIAEDASDVEAHLLLGRAYLLDSQITQADDAFSDAVALGGEKAAAQVDEQIRRYGEAMFNEHFGDDHGEEEELRRVIEAYDLLLTDEGKLGVVEGLADFFLGQAKDLGRRFESDYFEFVFAELADERLDLNKEDLRPTGERVIEELLQITESLPEGERGDQAKSAEEIAEYFYGRGSEDLDEISKRVDALKSDRERAKTTMADMRTIATAIAQYAVDHNRYPSARSVADLRTMVEPRYIRRVPVADGWGKEFLIESGPDAYVIVSAGADREFGDWRQAVDRYSGNSRGEESESFSADIIHHDGIFIRNPSHSMTSGR